MKNGIALHHEDDAVFFILACIILHNMSIYAGDMGEGFLVEIFATYALYSLRIRLYSFCHPAADRLMFHSSAAIAIAFLKTAFRVRSRRSLLPYPACFMHSINVKTVSVSCVSNAVTFARSRNFPVDPGSCRTLAAAAVGVRIPSRLAGMAEACSRPVAKRFLDILENCAL